MSVTAAQLLSDARTKARCALLAAREDLARSERLVELLNALAEAPDDLDPAVGGLPGTAGLWSTEATGRRVAFVAFVERARELTASDLANLWRFDAIAAQLAVGRAAEPEDDWRPLVDQARAHGRPLHGWAYVFARSTDDARREARAHAELAVRERCAAWYCNAEAHWAGLGRRYFTRDPEAAALAYAEAFRSEAERLAGDEAPALVWAGFEETTTHAFDRDRPERPMCTDRVVQAFDGFSPMNYGTRRGTIADKYQERHDRAQALGVPYGPLHGSGRFDADDRVRWGFWKSGDGQPGLRELIAQDPPAAVCPYLGRGSGGMVSRGYGSHPAWVDVLESMDQVTA